MSRGVALLFLALAGILAPGSLSAQGEEALRREVVRLQRAVDSLGRRSTQASTLAVAAWNPPIPDQVDDLFRPIQVGGLRLRANESPLPVAEAAERAWEIMTEYYGRHLSKVELPVLTIQGVDPDSLERRGPSRADIVVPWDMSVSDLAWLMVRSRIPPSGDQSLDDWAGGSPGPNADRSRALSRAFEELMFSPYSRGHDCAVAELSACTGALRLGAPDVQVADAFPVPSDRRHVAAVIGLYSRDPALRGPLDRCLEGKEDAACDAVLRALPPGTVPAVGGQESRRSLLDAALDAGGPEAFARLVATAGMPMGERLSAAAGMPLPDLLARWREEMRRARPTASPWSLGTGVAGLAWALVFAMVALLGSRWRAD